MDVRNIIHQKKENKKQNTLIFAISIIVIIFITILISNIIKSDNKIKYNIWDNIQISGTIVTDDNYPINTHKIYNDTMTFGLKSSNINLNNIIDKIIIIDWTIDDIDHKQPILSINNIKDPKAKLIIDNNKYFFTNELISFDFSQDTDIRAEKTNWYIQIYYQDQPIVSIETFICNKITPTQDCDNMIYTYTKNLNEMFTTYLWYTFYKNNENSWITFNNKTLWYIVKTTDNDFLLSISHLINIVNSSFIAEHKKDLITENCVVKSWVYLNTFDSIKTQIIDENLVKFDISWLTNEWQRINCKLITSIRDDRDIKNVTRNEIK